jgi:hypothetical protein
MSHCYYVGREQPRMIVGRHDDDCPREDCRGCQPCLEPKCRVCGITHANGTCAECLAETRDNLRSIGRMCDALPAEVEHRGVNGEAMMLLGPAADPEARGHLEASVMAGRLTPDAIEISHLKGCKDSRCMGCAGELHPLYVLGSWDSVWREALDHDEPLGRVELAATVDYLDRTMSYMADFPHVPFEDFARDLRRCVAHLEAVLHDGEQVDRGAPCMTCHAPLERAWGDDESGDGWKCPRCRERSTEAQYRFAVAHLHREEATELTDRDMEIRTGIKAGTIRVWANRGLVKRRRDSGRTLYTVADVVEQARTRGLVS